ncbi:MAG: GDP-mannose 4,6-dehydratase [Candidatus Buchananbacteria bacterium CG10_big_fil_rev_8_21_14_0_10_42_9]|uniref:GDP-mannose 4,6-dehydratase n=1 Tax=Candidatus Buchananbacteria bacterium CG10_big_fil_rev_8_21_14_0_10_42_9 TaxID=1974526 RepID=A0A2H0W0D3_9BACT|nr:MAG: GDP-mannose 4,6-dehydratase [Candidatus Buchananbacteria bacterium CG10_big_fil_rev_8_21_14_0_10_42_9]
MKKALITGINGQDGSYLAEFLLDKGYEVHGIIRRSSTFNRWRIEHLHHHLFDRNPNFYLDYGDLTDSSSLLRIIKRVAPDEIYNLGAQSHVQVSFETPEYTANVDGVGVLRMIEAVRILGLEKKTKFFQASTSEMFGKAVETPQNENTPFYPRSPYGAAKVYAYWIIKNYREAYGIHATNATMFNHESPRRGENFVTKKITQSLAKVKLGKQEILKLGNLEAKRDWGYAKEYMEVAWKIMQQPKPDDYVIATGESHTVREFVEETCRHMDFNLEWQGQGRDEKGIDKKTGKTIIELDDRYLRPSEVDHLQGDASKAKKTLNWEPKVKFKELVKMMAEYDLKNEENNNAKLID